MKETMKRRFKDEFIRDCLQDLVNQGALLNYADAEGNIAFQVATLFN